MRVLQFRTAAKGQVWVNEDFIQSVPEQKRRNSRTRENERPLLAYSVEKLAAEVAIVVAV